MNTISNRPQDVQTLSMDSRNLESLKMGAKAEKGSKTFDEAIDKVAVQFESVFLQWALKSMRDATPEGGLFDDANTKTYQSMYDQELVQQISGKGLGLASEIARQLRAGSATSAGVTSTGATSSAEQKPLLAQSEQHLLTLPKTGR